MTSLPLEAPFVCTGSALFCPRFVMGGHRPLAPFLIRSRTKALHVSLGTATRALSLRWRRVLCLCLSEKERGSQTELIPLILWFHWFFVGWAVLPTSNNCPLGHKKPWYVVCANILGVLSPGLTSGHQCDITEYGDGKRCTQSVISRWGDGFWHIIAFAG